MIRLILGLALGALLMQFYLESGYHPPWTAHELREQVKSVIEELGPAASRAIAPEAAQLTERPAEEGLCLAPKRVRLPFFGGPSSSPPSVPSDEPAVATPEVSPRERTEALVRSQAAAAGLSPELVVALVTVESGFNPTARPQNGASSALGLFQFLRATRERYGVTDDSVYLSDIDLQVRLGVEHLVALRERFGGSYIDTLLAYHVGEVPVAEDRVPPVAFEYVDRILDEMTRMKEEAETS